MIWTIYVERGREVLFADTCSGISEYIPYLLRVARLVDEKLPAAVVKVITPEGSGVIGRMVEWEKTSKVLTFEGDLLKNLANAARYAGLNYT